MFHHRICWFGFFSVKRVDIQLLSYKSDICTRFFFQRVLLQPLEAVLKRTTTYLVVNDVQRKYDIGLLVRYLLVNTVSTLARRSYQSDWQRIYNLSTRFQYTVASYTPRIQSMRSDNVSSVTRVTLANQRTGRKKFYIKAESVACDFCGQTDRPSYSVCTNCQCTYSNMLTHYNNELFN